MCSELLMKLSREKRKQESRQQFVLISHNISQTQQFPKLEATKIISAFLNAENIQSKTLCLPKLSLPLIRLLIPQRDSLDHDRTNSLGQSPIVLRVGFSPSLQTFSFTFKCIKIRTWFACALLTILSSLALYLCDPQRVQLFSYQNIKIYVV